MSDLEAPIAHLEAGLGAAQDRAAIIELTGRYCRAVITDDVEELVSLFTEDGSLEAVSPPGSGIDTSAAQGHEGLRQMYHQSVGLGLLPCVHNHVVELDGDRATGFCSLEMRCVQNSEPYIGSGYYEDHCRREDGEWRFELRRFVMNHWAPHRQGWA